MSSTAFALQLLAENQQVTNARLAIEGNVLDPYSARERYMKVSNPAEIDERRHEWMWTEAIAQMVTNVMLARAGGSLQQATVNEETLRQKLAGATPFTRDVVLASLQGNGTGQLGRTEANSARTGRGQNLSELAGTQTGLPT